MITEERYSERKSSRSTTFFQCSFCFLPVIPVILAAFALDPRLVWLPYLMFLAWVIYIYGYRAKYVFGDCEEEALVERARGITYFVSLVVTLLLNAIVLWYSEITVRLIMIPSVGIILAVVDIIIPRVFFPNQVKLFTPLQKKLLAKTITTVTSVCIYYSLMVLSLDQIVFDYFLNNYSVYNVIWLVIIALFVFILSVLFIYPREKSSRDNGKLLAKSLRKTNWLKKYVQSRKRRHLS